MRKFLILSAVIFCFLSAPSIVNSTTINQLGKEPPKFENILKNAPTLKIKEIQKLIGRRLSLKEKLGIIILKHRLRYRTDDNSNQGKTALTFAIIALATLVIGIFVPYVIIASLISSIVAIVLGSIARKKNPDDKRAMAARLIGWITLGVIIVLLILAAIIVAAFIAAL